ncbi:hypothetical protein [Sphingomonas desiccabilis]|uniref:Uncharacterized protein n=1 Tax=Sphingomonas desiccabilis TaxID=429134 RepID=A0A4Q2J0I6_9SPHN|nr:hypothetical protein [Sphingomonas desiccabilis]MBB3910686.1 hypothetical protein [Sphingomonas desiccabilis]RXZ35308.1 hypothetical protein EO081_06690 [Sphingomonas desiccabilis]
MPVPPDPRGRPPLRRLAIILVIIAAIWGIIFVGYNLHHAKQMEEDGPSGQIAPSNTAQAQ